ncbi:hypothetical protein RDABS01_008800 [Bienertia sinuspersici]
MVCQAASQTRFRALKHENGVAGFATIIVRVIACFQPLRNCQIVVFRLMGMDFESWLHQQQPDGQFPNAKSLKLPLDLGMQKPGIPCAIPCTDTAPCTDPGAPDFKVGQLKESHGWQGFIQDTSVHSKCLPDADFPGKVPALVNENYGDVNVSLTDAQPAPKQFLVFDRTGDKTTLMLSSMMGTSNQCLNSWHRKPSCYYNVKEGELGNGSNGQFYSEPNLTDEFNNDNEISEMHEDTEDIDALLSSDDEDNYSDDDEETSTGRSPSWDDENEDLDEVASSAGPSKRQKLSDNDYEVPSVTYGASSLKPKRSLEYEDDAESSCAGNEPMKCGNSCTLSGSKRERKEKIREAVSILQTILPGGDGKDAVVVLDEAINYLKTLRLKAKSLGVSGL